MRKVVATLLFIALVGIGFSCHAQQHVYVNPGPGYGMFQTSIIKVTGLGGPDQGGKAFYVQFYNPTRSAQSDPMGNGAICSGCTRNYLYFGGSQSVQDGFISSSDASAGYSTLRTSSGVMDLACGGGNGNNTCSYGYKSFQDNSTTQDFIDMGESDFADHFDPGSSGIGGYEYWCGVECALKMYGY